MYTSIPLEGSYLGPASFVFFIACGTQRGILGALYLDALAAIIGSFHAMLKGYLHSVFIAWSFGVIFTCTYERFTDLYVHQKHKITHIMKPSN